MKQFKDWFNESQSEEKFPETGIVNGTWFGARGIPMIVCCTCCGMTMATPSAFVNEEGETFCEDCASGSEKEEGEDAYTLDDLGSNWY